MFPRYWEAEPTFVFDVPAGITGVFSGVPEKTNQKQRRDLPETKSSRKQGGTEGSDIVRHGRNADRMLVVERILAGRTFFPEGQFSG